MSRDDTDRDIRNAPQLIENLRGSMTPTAAVAANVIERLLAERAMCETCVEDFYRRVNARAEADMLTGRPVTGAHHRALETEIALFRRSRSAEL